jgi:membrane-associated protease RseP (regulator of RpoE activity)
MLNFDEVGRLRDQRLQIGGVDSGTGLRQMVEAVAANTGVKVATRGAPYAPSDHTHFYDGGVPVLFFHTGTHADYHAPTDTADRIDADGMALVAVMGSRVLQRLAEAGPPPVYARIPREQPAARQGVGGAFFGVAVHALSEDGVRLDSVVPGSAAEHAGMRVGDVVIRLAGASIESFQDLRATLQGKRPGDTVRVVYVRNGELHETSATLGEQ